MLNNNKIYIDFKSRNFSHLLSPTAAAAVLWCLRLFSCFRRSRFSWDSGSRIRSALWCFRSAFELPAKTSMGVAAAGSLMGEISGSAADVPFAASSFTVLCLEDSWECSF